MCNHPLLWVTHCETMSYRIQLKLPSQKHQTFSNQAPTCLSTLLPSCHGLSVHPQVSSPNSALPRKLHVRSRLCTSVQATLFAVCWRYSLKSRVSGSRDPIVFSFPWACLYLLTIWTWPGPSGCHLNWQHFSAFKTRRDPHVVYHVDTHR